MRISGRSTTPSARTGSAARSGLRRAAAEWAACREVRNLAAPASAISSSSFLAAPACGAPAEAGGSRRWAASVSIRPQKGGDIEADLLVTLEEALHGAKKKISFRREGSTSAETYEVRIPKGVREGQSIRLAGQGQAGSRKDLAGDLYLRVRFAQHPDYRIDGLDLVYELELAASKAVLGTEEMVPTPDGSVRLRIPAGTQGGQKFRIKGRGLPNGSDARGDLYVKTEILLPKTLSEEERGLWEKLRALGE